MKPPRMFLLVVACVALAAPLAFAQPTKPAAKAGDPAAKLPAPILTAFRTSYPNAMIKAARPKKPKMARPCGRSRASTTASRETWSTTRNGTVVEFEEQIDPASLPAAVSAALNAKYPKATITKAEKLMKGTTLTVRDGAEGRGRQVDRDHARGQDRARRQGEGRERREGRRSQEEVAAEEPRLEMKTLRLTICLALLAAGLLGLQVTLPAADGPYRQLNEISVGGEGGWDYLSVDSAARRLYVSHATKVVVIDIDKDAVVGEIAPTPGVHGIAVAPDLGRGFVSNGRENTVSIVDLKTLQIRRQRSRPGENPDAILYEPAHKEVYAFNGTRQVGHRLRRDDGRRSRRRSRCPASRSSRSST